MIGKETVSKVYRFQANMTWTIEPGTIQYIDEQIFGITVLGGHLLSIDQNGVMRLIWENPEAPLICGLYTHSIVYKKKIYFMPYLSEHMISFDYRSGAIELFDLPGRLPNERMHPYIYEEELYVISTDSGKMYRYQKNEKFVLTNEFPMRGSPLLPKRDMVDGRKRVFQRKMDNYIEFSIFDCAKNTWERLLIPECPFKDFIWDENYIWYASDEAVYEIRISNEADAALPKKILNFDCKKDFVSFVMNKEDSFLMFVEKSTEFYQFQKRSKIWEKIECDFLDVDKNVLVYQTNSEILILRQFDVRDWMIRPGEKYGILRLFSGDYTEIPLFTLEDSSRKLLNKSYIKSVWSVTPDNILIENEKEGPEFLMATITEEENDMIEYFMEAGLHKGGR